MKLDRMIQADFEKWAPASRRNYANDKIKANGLTAGEARDLAERDFTKLLPDGLASKDNHLFTIKEPEGEVVGYLWLSVEGGAGGRRAFLYDIVVNEEHRGRGVGKGAMLLLEQEAKKLGVKKIYLHVFGFNEKAIGLYKSLGYNVTDLTMSKKLSF